MSDDIHKKQLFAQRVGAVASLAAAVAAEQAAESLARMRVEAAQNAAAAAEAAERHQQELADYQREVAERQGEMAERQEQVAEEQRTADFRRTLLTGLKLLERQDEQQRYVLDQLLPRLRSHHSEYARSIGTAREVFTHFGLCDYLATFLKADPDSLACFASGKDLKSQRVALESLERNLLEASNAHKEARETYARHVANRRRLVEVCFWTVILGVPSALFLSMAYKSSVDSAFAEGLSRADYVFGTLFCWLMGGLFCVPLIMISIVTPICHRQKSLRLLQNIEACRKAEAAAKDAVNQHKNLVAQAAKTQEEHWGRVKLRLVDSYLASDSGKALTEVDFLQWLLAAWTPVWLSLAEEEQSFLPAPFRPSVEAWTAALLSEIAPVAETMKQRHSEIRNVLLQMIIPRYGNDIVGLVEADREYQAVLKDLHVMRAMPEGGDEEVSKEEDLIQKCIEIFCQERRASTALLQHRLRLGYVHARRIMDTLEQRGMVGPAQGAKDREVLIRLDDLS